MLAGYKRDKLADRFGWDVLIPDVKRRVRCAQRGRRTGGLVVGTPRRRVRRNRPAWLLDVDSVSVEADPVTATDETTGSDFLFPARSPERQNTAVTQGRTILRWLLWLMVGALLLLRSGTAVTTWDGALFLGPALFSAATLMWVFVTTTILWKRLVRSRR